MEYQYHYTELEPLAVALLSNYVLIDKSYMLYYYNIGSFINILLNVILKGIIQDPCPMYDERKINLAKSNDKHSFFQNGIPFHLFGMPSGHAQSCFFSTAFVYFVLRKMNWLYVYLFLSTLICYERLIHNHQSLLQVVVGGIIGISVAYALYMFTNEQIKGKIKEKPDDDGPI